MSPTSLELYDPRNGDVALKVETVGDGQDLARTQRSNYFGLYWVREGSGVFWSDAARHPFGPGSLLCVVPYQPFRICADAPVRGAAIQFHANFFCMEAHHAEVGCNGVLFNDVYGVPLVRLDAALDREFGRVVEAMRGELHEGGLAHPELLVSYLKILLVKATRLKVSQQAIEGGGPGRRPGVLDELVRLIEERHRTVRRPSEYARLLHLAPKSLARLVKTHLHKTLTELIRERVMRQAKWDLLHTDKPVKRIAAELGFEDVFYFSRQFRRATGMAPTEFRRFETTIRAGEGKASMP